MLEGRLVFQQWKAQDGTNRSRHALSVTEFKFLDGKSDSQDMGGNNYNAPQQMNQPQQQNYNAPAQQYSQPAQQNYNAPQQQQSGGMHSGQNAYEQNIPTIDIDNDEIPF